MMNEFEREYVRLAYLDLVQKGKKPWVDLLIQTAESLWVMARDVTLEMWMLTTLERVPASRLCYIANQVNDKLYECYYAGNEWEPPSKEEEVPMWVAYGLACLRWHYRLLEGREQGLSLIAGEVATWLQQREEIPLSRNPAQRSLFELDL